MKKYVMFGLVIYCIYVLYSCSFIYNEQLAHIYPMTEKKEIILNKATYTKDDYDLIFEQTGLGKRAVDNLENSNDIKLYQNIFFDNVDYRCIRNSPISCEEYVEYPEFKFADIEDGDVLITCSSHVFSWRNGHAAIIINSDDGSTVEAVVIGSNSSVQNISKWTHYPNVQVLRLKNVSSEERKRIAQTAADNLVDTPYSIFVGMYPPKYKSIGSVDTTQCAHLVWSAYAACGYDIDSNKGLIVTPDDIRKSELFETVQVYGVNIVP